MTEGLVANFNPYQIIKRYYFTSMIVYVMQSHSTSRAVVNQAIGNDLQILLILTCSVTLWSKSKVRQYLRSSFKISQTIIIDADMMDISDLTLF